MKVVAFMPAYNEAPRIGKVIDGTRKHADEVIVVDDCSEDNTVDVAGEHGAIVVRHERNMGSGAAYKDGFRKALEREADTIVLLHSDGQHDPDEIPLLLEPVHRGEAEYILQCEGVFTVSSKRDSHHFPVESGFPQ